MVDFLGRLGGVLSSAKRKFVEPVAQAVSDIGKRIKNIVGTEPTPDFSRAELEEMGIVDISTSGEPILPRQLSPFSSQVTRDPTINRLRDVATGQLISREDMRIRLAGHMRQVQIITIRQNRPDLSDREVLQLSSRFQEIAQARRLKLREEEFDQEFRRLDEEFLELQEETGLRSP